MTRVHVGRVELDLPEALEAHHVLEPQGHVAEGGEVRGGVVEAHEAQAVRPAPRRVVHLEARVERPVAVALDEPESRVAEGRRDREEGDRVPGLVLEPPDVVDRRPPSALEQAERLPDVLHLEVERADPVRVLAQPAPRPTALAPRLDAHHHAVAGQERERLLSARRGELLRALADLGEVHDLGVEAAAPLEVVDVVVHGLEPPDSERLRLGHA